MFSHQLASVTLSHPVSPCRNNTQRELLQQNETLQMRVNRYQATAKLNKAELGRKDLEAEEFVARYIGSEVWVTLDSFLFFSRSEVNLDLMLIPCSY